MRTPVTMRRIFAGMLIPVLSIALTARAQTTNGLSDAEIQGRQLAQQILEQRPAESFTNIGVFEIRNSDGKNSKFPLKCQVIVTPTNWASIYETVVTNRDGFANGNYLEIVHAENQPDEYTWDNYAYRSAKIKPIRSNLGEEKWSGTQFIHPFSQSDFWAVDLGLEFFHWPEQKLLRKEVKRSRGCSVLESTNPNPSANGYSRVVSWIDEKTLGIVQAKAYDSKNKLLKEFYPKDFKKVNGQWQVETMEIENDQTGSRTWLKFESK